MSPMAWFFIIDALIIIIIVIELEFLFYEPAQNMDHSGVFIRNAIVLSALLLIGVALETAGIV